MKDIVNIQITPVKNILINPLLEHFNPNDYNNQQVNKLKKKGYVESDSSTNITDTDTDNSNNTINNQGKTVSGAMMGWTDSERKEFVESLKKSTTKAKGENPKILNNINTLITDLSVIDNKNFTASSRAANNTINKAINDKILDAEKQYSQLRGKTIISNKTSVEQLKAEYESRINKWTLDYEKSINYYKEYIKSQEKLVRDLESQNVVLSDAMQRNVDKLNSLAKKWDAAQNKINNFEKELLQSNSKKYDEIIKSLKQQLAAEKVKQTSIDEKIAQLRSEKAQLDNLFAENLEKLKKAGFGSNCPKGFNMNDYIHKKKIPCWGCIL